MASHSKPQLTAVSAKAKGPGRHLDGDGLYLVVDPGGARRWVLRIVVRGMRVDIGLGAFGEVPTKRRSPCGPRFQWRRRRWRPHLDVRAWSRLAVFRRRAGPWDGTGSTDTLRAVLDPQHGRTTQSSSPSDRANESGFSLRIKPMTVRMTESEMSSLNLAWTVSRCPFSSGLRRRKSSVASDRPVSRTSKERGSPTFWQTARTSDTVRSYWASYRGNGDAAHGAIAQLTAAMTIEPRVVASIES